MSNDENEDVEYEEAIQEELAPADVKPLLRECYDCALQDVGAFFPYLDTAKHQVVALWLTGAWVVKAFPKYPLLHITGVKGSGKSVMASLAVRHGGMKHYMNPTTAVLFRAPVKRLIIDECETLDSDKVTVLNAAHQRGIKVPRLKANGGDTEISEFEPYGAYLIAGIRSRFPASLMSRMIQIPLRPYDWLEDTSRLTEDTPGHTSYLTKYSGALLTDMATVYSQTQTKLKAGRFRDCYRPLLVVAKYLEVNVDNLFQRLKEEENAIEDDESYTELETSVVRYLRQRVPTGIDWVKIGEIGSAVGITSNFYPLRESFSRLSFTRKKRTMEGIFLLVDAQVVDQIWIRMQTL